MSDRYTVNDMIQNPKDYSRDDLIDLIKEQQMKISQLQKQINAITSDFSGNCQECENYWYKDVQDSGYWCVHCQKTYCRDHLDEETGDICTVCNKMYMCF